MAPAAYSQLRIKDLAKDRAEEIMEDLAGVMAHTTASGASNLGKKFGFEVGVLASYAETPNIDRIVERSGGDTDYDALPNAGILGRVGITEWVVLEGVYFPNTDFGEYNIDIGSLAAQVILIREDPLNFALKAFYTNSILSYEQINDNLRANVELENDIYGIQALISKKIFIFEPYFGAGLVTNKGEIRVSGAATIFNERLARSGSVKIDGNSTQLFAGTEIDLWIMNLGVEVGELYGNTRGSVKVTFGF